MFSKCLSQRALPTRTIHINIGLFAVFNLPFLPARFHLLSHQLNFLEGLRAPLGPPVPGALAPATPSLGGPVSGDVQKQT